MSKPKKQKPEINLVTLVEKFKDEDACRQYLEVLRWPDGVVCPKCSSISISRVIERNQFDCNQCRYQFSVTAHTAFHQTRIPLWKWFLVAYMMIESKKGVSANQIKRTIGVTYKTAWYLCHRIRNAMDIDIVDLLEGIVEVDESYVGGKRKNMHKSKRKALKGRGTTGKTMVVGATERGGQTRLMVGKHADRKTLHGFIRGTVAPETEMIVTDEWPAYDGIEDEDTRHETVSHSKDEWVRGDVHTQTVESVWSLLKRSIVGSYHKVSAKHLDAYLDELEWRFNNRDNPYLFRDTLLRLIHSEHMSYEDLTAE
jgi:transposase-like protein